MLDFGCGGGASTVIMAKMYPRTSFIGSRLNDTRIRRAIQIARERALTNVEFLTSPGGHSLPEAVANSPCDVIVMCAVYEHLLPHERRVVMPLLWRLLRPGGLLFINQTPHSWFPYEHHSTGLWLINYAPDRICALDGAHVWQDEPNHWSITRLAAASPRRHSWRQLSGRYCAPSLRRQIRRSSRNRASSPRIEPTSG